MGLADPHVRVETVRRQAVAVGLLLAGEHQSAQLLRGKGVSGPLLENPFFEEVSAVDVGQHLGDHLQPQLQDAGPFLCRQLLHQAMDHQGFAKDGGGFRQGHGVFDVVDGLLGQLGVVIAVSQLVGQGGDVVQGAGEVQENPAFLQGVAIGAEGAAHLPLSGQPIHPAGLEGLVCVGGQVFAEASEQPEDHSLGLLGREAAAGLAQGGEEVVEGQAPWVAQQDGLVPQIAVQDREPLPDSGQHGRQGFRLQAAVGQGFRQGRRIAPELAQGQHLPLDGVQGEGRLGGDGRVGGPLGLIGPFPLGGAGGGGQGPNLREGQLPGALRAFIGECQLCGNLAVQQLPGR